MKKSKKTSKKYGLTVVIEHDKDGYFAFCPDLQGCYTQGDTHEEILKNIKEVVALHIKDRLARGEGIPKVGSVSLSTVFVTL